MKGDILLDKRSQLGCNLFAYCWNNPTNYWDPYGNDAIWLQDTNAVVTMGHTGLLLQDKYGEWWHFYWGNNRDGSKGKTGSGEILLKYSGDIEFGDINEFYKKHYRGSYEKMIYFDGDFSKSVSYAKNLDTKKYNLITNNCMQASTDVLRQGKFSNNNNEYQEFLKKIRFSVIPNVAYDRILSFALVVSIWNTTPWYLKWAVMSPLSAVILL